MVKNQEETRIRRNKQNKKKGKKMYLIIPLIIIFLLIIAITYWAFTDKSTIGQIESLDKAIQKNNYKKITEIVKEDGKQIPETDAKKIAEYFNKKDNQKKYHEEIEQIKSDIKNNKNSDSNIGAITDKKGKPIISISKNGVKSFIFKELSFTPHYQTVYINEPDNEATYKFNHQEKNTTAIANSKQTELGKFIAGNYTIRASKTFDNKEITEITNNNTVDGNIHVNTDNPNKNGKIYAEESFPQAWFKVDFKNTDKLKKDFTLYINDEKVSYKKGKIYGKYPAEVKLNIKAKGKYNNHTINTDEIEVEKNDTNKPQTLTLTFDNNEIDKQIKKEKEVEKNAKSFLNDYTRKLNNGYEDSDFNQLKKYFADEKSDVATNIQKQVESKKNNHYSRPKFKSYKRNGNEIIIILSKTNHSKEDITSQYKLIYNEKNEEFKIKEYTDI